MFQKTMVNRNSGMDRLDLPLFVSKKPLLLASRRASGMTVVVVSKAVELEIGSVRDRNETRLTY